MKGGKSGGYAKQRDVFDVPKILEAVQKEEKQVRFAFCGDLLTEMRKRKSKHQDGEQAAKKTAVEAAAGASVPATPAAAPATPAVHVAAPAAPALSSMACGSKDQDNSAAAGTDGVDGEFDLSSRFLFCRVAKEDVQDQSLISPCSKGDNQGWC